MHCVLTLRQLLHVTKNSHRHCIISLEKSQEKHEREPNVDLIWFCCKSNFYSSPCSYLLGVFIFCNYSSRLHWTWILINFKKWNKKPSHCLQGGFRKPCIMLYVTCHRQPDQVKNIWKRKQNLSMFSLNTGSSLCDHFNMERFIKYFL